MPTKGGSTKGGASVGLNPKNVVSTTSLISAREGSQREVDQTLTVLRDVESKYGVVVEDAKIATLKGAGRSTMAYYDNSGNLAINKSYFDAAKMDAAYDGCVREGFHPSRGNKTGIEAVTAHEMGHRLTDAIGEKTGRGKWAIDAVSNDVVKQAARNAGYGRNTRQFISKISGYAKSSNAEALAEAFADVYCNGARASRESRAIVDIMNSYF